MDNALDNAPSVIEAAAQSPLGILALLILTVGVIAYLFFQKSSDRVKVVIFSMIFVGMAGFGLVILVQAAPTPSPGDGPERTVGRSTEALREDRPTPEADRPAQAGPPAARPLVDVEEPEPARRTEISLAYLGDLYSCGLQLQVRIGDQTAVPQGNSFRMSGVLEGPQPYEIRGSIQCPYVGSCEAVGEGTLTVVPNAAYNVVWQGTDSGLCDVTLQRG